MRYALRSCYLENTHKEPIDSQQFQMIKRSRRILTAAFEIEDIFDNLISNYIEVETRCLELTTRRLARLPIGYREGNEALASINLAFVNYLSTARAYVDKVAAATSRCFEESRKKEVKKSVKELLSEQYDAKFGYRFMEALRNHVQHSGSALHTLSQGSRPVHADGQHGACFEYFLLPLCNKSNLADRGDFKAAVLNECPDVVNLLECIRFHAHGLSSVQRAVREIISTTVSDAATCMREGQAALEEKVSGSLDGTEAISINQDDEVEEKVPMLLQWEDVRGWLIQRNQGIPPATAFYPSGRAASGDA